MNLSLREQAIFPDGTVVGLYPIENWLEGQAPTSQPLGDPYDTATVTDGEAVFADVPPGIYYVYGEVEEDKWRYVIVQQPTPSAPSPEEPGEDGQVWTTVDGAPGWADSAGGLPEVSSEDNGKVLGVVEGEPTWVEPSDGGSLDWVDYTSDSNATSGTVELAVTPIAVYVRLTGSVAFSDGALQVSLPSDLYAAGFTGTYDSDQSPAASVVKCGSGEHLTIYQGSGNYLVDQTIFMPIYYWPEP